MRHMNAERLLNRILTGNVKNVRFRDMTRLCERLGFSLQRTTGSHHIFSHNRIDEMLNLQEVRGEVKPYQVRQLVSMIRRYNLTLEDSS